ncbi:MAG: PLP-dependent transferase [Acidobacteriota bacterium]|nr:PLP-dependent transferase [Acidobacteriota bacterium]
MRRREEDEAVASWLVAAGRGDEPGAPLNTPLVPASNFVLGAGRAYARSDGTPTWAALEELVGGLEQGHAVAFASGMAAVAAVFAELGAGAMVTLPEDCYQGVSGLAEAGRRQGRWSVDRLPLEDTAAWIAAAGESDLVWIETPSNPLLVVADLAAICAAPRRPGAILAVDNTFATPLNQQPLRLGADVAVHSATKLIGGHSDLLAGVAVAKDEAGRARLAAARALAGATPGALEAYLAVRGARTLALRLERSQRTALLLAERLAAHPAIERVRYPGLASHPTHAVAAAQLAGFGSVLCFEVAGGADPADAACRRVRLIRHATSLGGVESTLERRSAVPGQEHLPAGLVRLSVGIEDPEDLWRDLARALV